MALLHSLALLGVAVAPAAAFWRLPCKAPIVVERADPIVVPGQVSNHVHTIMGGNGFDFIMDYNSTQQSTCSSCTVIGDNSNYWVPTLWYQAEDGSFEEVDQLGGATIYYLQRGKQGEKLKAFPPGFRMIAGDPFKRQPGDDFASQAISYACLDYSGGKPETGGFPNYNCPNGLRAQVFFPSCWNGKDLDVADHKSHMSYPIEAHNSGSCPPDFPVHLVSLFFEILWDTGKFANRWHGNKQPFVFSMGDPTGYGGHGDFVMGWEEQHLQRAVDTCTSDSGRVEDCPEFQLIPDSQAEGCTVPPRVNEPTTGTLSQLPGCNPVQPGPDRATIRTDCGATTDLGQADTSSLFKDLTEQGWGYVGCGTDNYYNRILTGANTAKDDMTNDKCVAFCDSKGFSIAGTEFGRECYCGNSIPDSGAPVPGVPGNCKMPCAGDESQMCGGAGNLGLYKKGAQNANFGVKPGSGSVAAPAAPAASPSSTAVAGADASSGKGGLSSVSPVIAIPAPSDAASPDQPAAASSPADTTTTGQSDSPTHAASPPDSSPNSPSPATDLPSGWSYKGCFVDTVFPRSLPQWGQNGPSTTNAKCTQSCESKGFSVAGTEYAGQCFCGGASDVEGMEVRGDEECDMDCSGKEGEACGGPGTLSVYVKGAEGGGKKRSAVVRHLEEHGHGHGHGRKHGGGRIGG